MQRPDVTIVILNYNTFRLVHQCIQSTLAETQKVKMEIIVVDNGSSERDPEDLKKLYPEITLIKSMENLGFSKGNNLGIQRANGKYILLLNSDTLLKNDAVSICKFFLDDNPNIAVATARLENPNGRIQHNCQRFPSVRWLLYEWLRLQKIFPSLKNKFFGSFFSYHSIAYPDWVWGTFFMFRKDLLNQLPKQKLADDFFLYEEDMQWCMDFSRLGYRIAYLPSAHVVHLMEGSGGKKNFLMKQNRKIFMRLYYSSWERGVIKILNFMLTGKYGY